MNDLNLFVYVSNSSVVGSSGQQLCKHWKYQNAGDIMLICRKGLKGQFLHIALRSTLPTILIICGIVVNAEPGPHTPVNLLHGRVTISSSGFEVGQPPTLAIDGNTSHNKKFCASFISVETATGTWLRVDLNAVRYIHRIVLLFPSQMEKRAIATVTVSIGRDLGGNDLIENTQCSGNNVLGDFRAYFECKLPVLGQFIYINTPIRSLEICEIEVFCDNFLNIYSQVSFTASDHRTIVLKPFDLVLPSQGAWKALKSISSWWRMAFPERCAVFAVEIMCSVHCMKFILADPGVYVGDSAIVNSGSNVKCGNTLLANKMIFRCSEVVIGKYIYIVTSGRPESQLFMSNISVYGYEGLYGKYIGKSETDLVVGARMFTVTWPNPVDQFSPIIGFHISYKEKDSINFTNFGFVNAATTYSSVSVRNLQPYTSYIFKVVPWANTGALKMESIMHITTAVSFPSAPRMPQVSVDSESILVVRWMKPKSPNGPIDAYNVYLHKVDDMNREYRRSPLISRVSAVGRETSIRISGLEKQETYDIAITASNIGSDGKQLEGLPSEGIEISISNNQTHNTEIQTAPSPPQNILITAINSTSLNVSWEPSRVGNGALQTYEIFYESTKFAISSSPRVVTVPASKLFVVLTGLSRGSNYSISVRARADTVFGEKLSIPSNGSGVTLLDSEVPFIKPMMSLTSEYLVPSSSSQSGPSLSGQSIPFSVKQSKPFSSTMSVPLSSSQSSPSPDSAAPIIPHLSLALSLSQSAPVSSLHSSLVSTHQSTLYPSSQSMPFFSSPAMRSQSISSIASTHPSALSSIYSALFSISQTPPPLSPSELPLSQSAVISTVQSSSGQYMLLSSNQPAPFSSISASHHSSNGPESVLFSFNGVKQSSSSHSELSASQPIPLTSSHAGVSPTELVGIIESNSSGMLSVAIAIAVVGTAIVVVIIVIIIVHRRRSRVDEMVPNMPEEKREKKLSRRQSDLSRPSVVTMDYKVEDKLSPLVVGDFERHVQEMHSNDNHGFSIEFTLLDRESQCEQATTAAMMKYNKTRNNYENVLPFDYNRVMLKQLAGIPGSDYINASYVNAYDLPKGYIAAQGPNDKTINDFWRMIWQENVQTIVMVTNLEEQGEELCSCYWPALQEDTEYGSVAVMFKEELVLSEVTKRVFQVKHCEEGESKSRVVTQFQFTGWSCDDVPLYAFSFLNFVLRIRTYHDGLEMKHPILVHCSDGAGQTGTFIASDYTIQKLNKERKVDIFELIKELRLQRTSLVETKEQYIFCHDFALVFMLCGNTSIPVNQLGDYILRLHEADPLTENTGFDTHFKLLDRLTPHDESTNGTFAATAAVRGYRQKHEYITTQVPNESTAEDFWNLVWDQNFKFIITLTHLEGSEEETSLQYWPSKETSEYDSVLITLQEEEKMEEYAVRKFNLTSKQSSTERVITQFIYLAWSDGKVPETCSQLLEMINRIESEQQQVDNKSLVVTCSDGVHKSGLFCAMSIIVDALKTEHVVDVFKTILALRLHNPDFVSNQEEYRFCYDLALKCVNSLRTQAV